MKSCPPKPVFSRDDTRTVDEFLREWAKSEGTLVAAARASGVPRNHLHSIFYEPYRRGGVLTMEKIARAAEIPVEALLYRFTRICDLDFWNWVDRFK